VQNSERKWGNDHAQLPKQRSTFARLRAMHNATTRLQMDEGQGPTMNNITRKKYCRGSLHRRTTNALRGKKSAERQRMCTKSQRKWLERTQAHRDFVMQNCVHFGVRNLLLFWK